MFVIPYESKEDNSNDLSIEYGVHGQKVRLDKSLEKDAIGYMIAYGVTCLFIIIILISLSKLLFTLAKSFMVEAIRCSDRIHAISFGKFFLDAYGAEASREEVLKAFSSWNIDNGSTSFRNQSGEDYDPKIADIINILKK